jgi:hypothetical protein
MRNRAWGVIAALAVIACVGGAGVVVAGESEQGPGQTREAGELRTVEAHSVPAPRGAVETARVSSAARAKPKKKREPTLVYRETAPQTLAPGPVGFRVGFCPKRARAINGYYYLAGTATGFGLDNQGDSPVQGLREWAFYLDSSSGAAGVTFGLICLKNVK